MIPRAHTAVAALATMSPVDESVDPLVPTMSPVVVDQPSSTCSVGLSHGLVGERGVFDACRLGVRIA
jgi:hypothetical protein